MTLQELSVVYRSDAERLSQRVHSLEEEVKSCRNSLEKASLEDRVRILSTMLRESRELAVLTERYYERGYRRNVKYTI